jgi:hypothetical protein
MKKMVNLEGGIKGINFGEIKLLLYSKYSSLKSMLTSEPREMETWAWLSGDGSTNAAGQGPRISEEQARVIGKEQMAGF